MNLLDDDPNATWEAYKSEVDEHKRLVALRRILQDMAFIACVILRDQDSCLEKVRAARSIPF